MDKIIEEIKKIGLDFQIGRGVNDKRILFVGNIRKENYLGFEITAADMRILTNKNRFDVILDLAGNKKTMNLNEVLEALIALKK